MYVTTSFVTTRIIYGVEASFSTGRPYPAHRRAALTEVSLFTTRGYGLRSNAVDGFVLSKSIALSRKGGHGAFVWRLSFRTEWVLPRNPIYSIVKRGFFTPHSVFHNFFRFYNQKIKNNFSIFSKSFFCAYLLFAVSYLFG